MSCSHLEMMSDNSTSDKLRALLLAALMIVSVFGATLTFAGAAVGDSAGNTYVVDAAGNTGFDTIQDALDSDDVGPDDTVVVEGYDGTYETFSVPDSDVTIRAAEGDRPEIDVSQSRIEPTAGTSIIGFDIDLEDGTTIYTKGDGFTLRDNEISMSPTSSYGLRVGDAANVEIRGNDFTQREVTGENTPQGIVLSSTTDALVVGNTLDGNAAGQGILVSNNPGDTTGATLRDNDITGFNQGILLYQNTDEISDVTVESNTITGAASESFQAFDDSGSDGFVGINGEDQPTAQLEAIYDENTVTNVAIDDTSRSDAEGSPSVTEAVLRDTNDDGSIDTVDVTVDESVDDTTLDPADFVVGGVTPESVLTGEAPYDGAFTLTVARDADISTGSVEVTLADGADVTDLAGNALQTIDQSVVVDEAAPNVDVVTPSERTLVDSTDVLDLSYSYTESGESVQDVTVTLTQAEGDASYTYAVDSSQYTGDGATKSLALDLDRNDETLADGAYTVSVEVTDDNGETVSGTTAEPHVVVDDEAPEVFSVNVDPDSDVGTDAEVDVSYTYQDVTNAASVTVHVVAEDTVPAFTTGDFENADFSQVTKNIDSGNTDQSVSVDLSTLEVIEDNSDYQVFVTATDENGNTNLDTDADPIVDQTPAGVDVNAEAPGFEAVDANVGSDTVTVTFTEAVVAGDGDETLDRSDFVYQDNAGPASSITGVERIGPDTVQLTLDAAVDSEDLSNDLISVRAEQVVDTDGENARPVPSDATIALADTSAPSEPTLTADGAVNADNAQSYGPVTVAIGDTVGDVELAVTDGETSVTTEQTDVTGEVTFTDLDLSELSDVDLTVTATVTDASSQSASDEAVIEKDTVAPELLNAEVDAGTSVVQLTTSERLGTVSPEVISVSGEEYTVDAVADPIIIDIDSDDEEEVVYPVTLSQAVPPEDLEQLTVESTATDAAGNPVTGSVTIDDTTGPSVISATAAVGETSIVVETSEPLGAEETTASTFTYTDESGGDATTVTGVEELSATEFRLTLDSPVSPADTGTDTVSLAAGVSDLAGNERLNAPFVLEGVGDVPDLRLSADDTTLTVTVVSDQPIADTLGGPVSVAETNREFTAVEGFELEDRFTESISPDSFTEQSAGVYTATVEAPEDSSYTASALVGEADQTATAVVDTEAPAPTDAVLLGVSSAAQLDDTRNTPRVRVLFSEPIDASEVSPNDVSIEGFNGDIVAVQSAGAFGALEIVLEGELQTGNAPDVTIAGDSYTDLAGTAGESGGATTIHTDVLDLEEGINFVSVPAASGGLNVEALPTENIESISRYDAADSEFDVYVPGAPDNSFTQLAGGEGYVVRMTADASVPINVNNEPAGADAPNSVDLSEGYNLVGHFQEDEQAVEIALSSVTADQDSSFEDVVFRVLRQDESADGFSYESYRADEFDDLERGEAYFVFVTSDQSYTEAPMRGGVYSEA